MGILKGTGAEEEMTFATFGCNVWKADPETPDRTEPDEHIMRRGAETLDLIAPDGRKIRVWTFVDSKLPVAQQRPTYPAPPIRVRQGNVVHTTLTSAKGPHTIHHHGIEPTTANDGVGHVSFEVGATYTYQWEPTHPGTFFYHCHRNTVLHFELGMFGLLIVDPPKTSDGKNYLFADGPTYDVERCWVADDMDPRWHRIADHDAGLCGLDVGLNVFKPEYFLLSGVFSDRTLFHRDTQVKAALGQRILIRLLNASYSVLRVTLGCDAELVACDGHCLGREAWNTTTQIPAGEPFEMCSAQRYDLILTPPARGVYPVRMEFRDWITGRIQHGGKGIVRTRILIQ